MDGLSIKLKTTDGVEASYKLTPRIIVAFEQNFHNNIKWIYTNSFFTGK